MWTPYTECRSCGRTYHRIDGCVCQIDNVDCEFCGNLVESTELDEDGLCEECQNDTAKCQGCGYRFVHEDFADDELCEECWTIEHAVTRSPDGLSWTATINGQTKRFGLMDPAYKWVREQIKK